MADDPRDVTRFVARAPEVGGNLLRSLLETAINGTGAVPIGPPAGSMAAAAGTTGLRTR